VDLFLSLGFQVGISDVGAPHRLPVQSRQEDCHACAAQRDDAGADSLDRSVREMSAGDKSSFVSTVVSDGIDKVGGDLLVSWRRTSAMSETLGCPRGLSLTQSESLQWGADCQARTTTQAVLRRESWTV